MGGGQKSNWYPDRGSRLTGIKVEIEVGGWNLGQAQGKRQAKEWSGLRWVANRVVSIQTAFKVGGKQKSVHIQVEFEMDGRQKRGWYPG